MFRSTVRLLTVLAALMATSVAYADAIAVYGFDSSVDGVPDAEDDGANDVVDYSNSAAALTSRGGVMTMGPGLVYNTSADLTNTVDNHNHDGAVLVHSSVRYPLDNCGPVFSTAGAYGGSGFSMWIGAANHAGGQGAGASTADGALSGGDYFRFTVTPLAGDASIDLESFSFAWRQAYSGDTRGPESIGVFVGSQLAGTFAIPETDGSTSEFKVETIVLDADDIAAGNQSFNITSATDVSVVIFNGNTGSDHPNRPMGYDAFTLNGSINPIPEPASAALVALGALCMLCMLGRRRKQLHG